jgi:hypothetical protein
MATFMRKKVMMSPQDKKDTKDALIALYICNFLTHLLSHSFSLSNLSFIGFSYTETEE